MIEIVLALILGISKPQPPKIIPAETPQVAPVSILEEVWGDRSSQAEKVIWCESRGKPDAVNGRYIGLFQIDYVLWGKEYGLKKEDFFDERINHEIARKIFNRSGSWNPWPNCKPKE